MPKFTTIGWVAKGTKKDPKKSYIKITNDVSLTKGQYVQLYEPRKGKNQTDQEFEEEKGWKRFNLVLVSDGDSEG